MGRQRKIEGKGATLNFRVTEAEKEALTALAKKTERSYGWLLRRGLQLVLVEQGK